MNEIELQTYYYTDTSNVVQSICNILNSVAKEGKVPELEEYVEYIYRKSHMPFSVLIVTHNYIERLVDKQSEITVHSNGLCRIYFTAFILATKYLVDDAYSTEWWVKISDNMFDVIEIFDMEREFLEYLEFNLFIDQNRYCKQLKKLNYLL